jgi:hypothetical protein
MCQRFLLGSKQEVEMKKFIDEPAAEIEPVEEKRHVIERPNGFYWVNETSGREYGPFKTSLAATQDMQSGGDDDFGEGESLEEAEAEIGITDWIDPDTGIPAEETNSRFSGE